MDISSELLKLLVCPVSKKGNLVYDKASQQIISPEAGLAYPIKDGIPIMLADQAKKVNIKNTKTA
jgi:uncharacterized protein